MTLEIPKPLFQTILHHLESAYPEEAAGFLLGRLRENGRRRVEAVLPVDNVWPGEERARRYRIPPEVLLLAEEEAERRGLWVLGVYHSHPDHPSQPSEFDRLQALPNTSYLIVSVRQGRARQAQSWRLTDDRARFEEEPLVIAEG